MSQMAAFDSRGYAPAAWPWRGLGLAGLLAVLAHIAAFMLANTSFVFSFQRPDTNATLSTRMLDPVPVSLLPPSSPATKAVPDNTRAPAPSAIAKPELLRTDNTAAQLPLEPKIEPKQPVAGIESAQAATETVASLTPSEQTGVTPTAAPAAGAPSPQGIKLSYPASAKLLFDGTVTRKGSSSTGSGVLSWNIDGNSYNLSLEATALLIFNQTERSEGKLSSQGLAPERYSSVRTGRSEQATHFVPEQGKIKFSNNKPDEILLVGAQDRLSALIQLAGIIGGDVERYKIVNRIQMQVAGLDSAEIWEFNLQGISDINLPAANMQALKLTRQPRNEFDQRLEIWLSPQLGYLPIRIRQSSSTTPEQDFTDLVLRKLP
jgi:hypothetical protein